MNTPTAVPPLNAAQSSVLRTLVDGGRVEARRTYPHEHHFTLVNDKGYRYAAKVPRETIARLLELGLIQDCSLDEQHDAVNYVPTHTAGVAVRRGTALARPDESQLDQLDLLGDVA